MTREQKRFVARAIYRTVWGLMFGFLAGIDVFMLYSFTHDWGLSVLGTAVMILGGVGSIRLFCWVMENKR